MTSRRFTALVPYSAMLAVMAAATVASTDGVAQSLPGSAPTVTVTGAATLAVPNDRLQAWLRADADSVSAATAASQVNAIIAKALSDAKAFAAVKVATAGYSTQQISDKGKPTRWRVSQGVTLDSSDFTAAATLISKLQDEDGLVVSSMGFSLTDKTRRDAEDNVTEQAIKSWQARSVQAARGLGFAGWRPSHISVQTSDGGRVYPMMRAQAAASYEAKAPPPVPLEAGTTDITVTVTGDAVLDSLATPTR